MRNCVPLKIVTVQGKIICLNTCPPPVEMAMVAYSWRLCKGGLLPTSGEEHLRNIEAYCRTVAPIGTFSRN